MPCKMVIVYFLIEITTAGFQRRKEFALGTVPQINYSTTENVYN